MAKADVTAQRLRELLHYDPDTGVFTRLTGSIRYPVGSVAGGDSRSGHVRINIFRQGKYLAHRLAWLHVHGEWPNDDIDHIDGNPSNNKLSNLRCVSRRMNVENQRKPAANNVSGFLGVSWCRLNKRWKACIQVNGRTKHLGLYSTPEAAHEAYLIAKRKFHPGCTI